MDSASFNLVVLVISLNSGIPCPNIIGLTKSQNSSISPSFNNDCEARGLPNIKIFFPSCFFKDIIISSLEYLALHKKIEVYAFVITPNHIHFIWQMIVINNKEMPHTSFLKYTAHAFKKQLLLSDLKSLELYAVDAKNKYYEFWQRDSLAFELFKKKTIDQKIEYIHFNPTMQRWNLCKEPADYYYSSAGFYE